MLCFSQYNLYLSQYSMDSLIVDFFLLVINLVIIHNKFLIGLLDLWATYS